MNKIKTLITLLACLVSIAWQPLPSNAATTGTGYTAVAAGDRHTVALKTDGSLWAWGNNASGQLGDGTTTQSLIPKQIGTGYSAISAGYSHTIALKTDGSLWAWGSNTSGQLGDGTTTQSLAPKQIGTGYSAISAGYSHTIALKTDGSLWAWGSNTSGQLGDGTTTQSFVPKQVGTGYSAISAGSSHTIALKSGSLWAWGNNAFGQLGDGTTTQSLMPEQIFTDFGGIGSGLRNNTYSAIASGIYNTVALKLDGSLWAWGSNNYGQLGDGTTTQSLVPKQVGTGYSAISSGYSHTIAIKSDGSLWAWGNNSYGQLGYGTIAPSLVPKQIGTDTYTTIALGSYHTAALKPDGSLWTWGSNYYGQLGDGTTTDSLVPKQIIDTGYTGTPDTTAPGIPTGLSVTSQTTSTNGNYVNLFWTPSMDNVGVSIYKIYREGVWTGGGITANSSIETGLTTDRFTVSACDVSGNCSAQSVAASATSSTQAPSVPTGLTATAVSATQINLAWISSVSNMEGVTYEIYRTSLKNCMPPPGPSLACDTGPDHVTKPLTTLSPQTSYTDTGLTPSTAYDAIYGLFGSSYSYFVRACDAAGNCSAASAPVSTMTQPLPVTLRTPPAATGTSYGPLNNQTIRITMAPPANIPNLSGTVIFVAAVLPPSMGNSTYFWNGSVWSPYTSCAAPLSKIWGLDATQYLDVVPTPTNLLSLKGTKIYVGYGIGAPYTAANYGSGTDTEACTDMLNNSTYTLAYTIN